MIINNTKYLTEREASQRYGYSLAWFQKKRQVDSGPPYVKSETGRVRYPIEELDKWFETTFNYNKIL